MEKPAETNTGRWIYIRKTNPLILHIVVRSLEERLSAGESVICAEGYLLELARRGYISYGGFIPEVVLECSEMVKRLHYEFAHCGTDVIEAFQVCV